MIETDLIRTGYDEIAARYVEERGRESIPYLDRLNDRAGPDSLVLDLGCGAGISVDRYLVDHGHRVIGLDICDAGPRPKKCARGAL